MNFMNLIKNIVRRSNMSNERTVKKKKMNEVEHLILDSYAIKIETYRLLIKRSVSDFFTMMKPILIKNGIDITESTFKNILYYGYTDKKRKIEEREEGLKKLFRNNIDLRRNVIRICMDNIDFDDAFSYLNMKIERKISEALKIQKELNGSCYDDTKKYTFIKKILFKLKGLNKQKEYNDSEFNRMIFNKKFYSNKNIIKKK